MKAYLITTGSLFLLVTLLHVVRMVAEWSRVRTDPGFVAEMVGLSVLTALLSFWAWRLLRTSGHGAPATR